MTTIWHKLLSSMHYTVSLFCTSFPCDIIIGPFQNVSIDEFVDMSSCNLAKTMHKRWKQASGDRGADLYIATIDDYVRKFF